MKVESLYRSLVSGTTLEFRTMGFYIPGRVVKLSFPANSNRVSVTILPADGILTTLHVYTEN